MNRRKARLIPGSSYLHMQGYILHAVIFLEFIYLREKNKNKNKNWVFVILYSKHCFINISNQISFGILPFCSVVFLLA